MKTSNVLFSANSTDNLAAADITSQSATLIVDISKQTGSQNSTQICSIDHLELKTEIKTADYVALFLSETEIESKKSTKRIEHSNALKVDGLNSGIVVCFEVSPIDACTNETMLNRTLASCAPIGKGLKLYVISIITMGRQERK